MKLLTHICLASAIFMLALVVPAVSTAETVLNFSAVSHTQEVYLQWNTTQENGVVAFKVQRSFDGRYYHTIETLVPKGNNSNYTYTDSDLFKSNLQTFYYRIEVQSASDRVEYSSIERVEMNFSGIRKTWGSIKAMFR